MPNRWARFTAHGRAVVVRRVVEQGETSPRPRPGRTSRSPPSGSGCAAGRVREKNQVYAILQCQLKRRPPMSDVFGIKGRVWLSDQCRLLPIDEQQAVNDDGPDASVRRSPAGAPWSGHPASIPRRGTQPRADARAGRLELFILWQQAEGGRVSEGRLCRMTWRPTTGSSHTNRRGADRDPSCTAWGADQRDQSVRWRGRRSDPAPVAAMDAKEVDPTLRQARVGQLPLLGYQA